MSKRFVHACFALLIGWSCAVSAGEMNGVFHYTRYLTKITVEPGGGFRESIEMEVGVDNAETFGKSRVIELEYDSVTESILITDAGSVDRAGRITKAVVQVRESRVKGNKVAAIQFGGIETGGKIFYKMQHQQTFAPLVGHFSYVKFLDDPSLRNVINVVIEYPDKIKMYFFGSAAKDSSRQLSMGMKARHATGLMEAEIGRKPIVLYSTLDSYRTLAREFQAEFSKQSADHMLAKGLADQIRGNATTQVESAKRIYDWIKKNIRYRSQSLYATGYRPNDMKSILEENAGDCKDHVFLYAALLNEIGIRSVPILMNTTDPNAITPIPTLRTFNHMLLFLPDLGVLADTTTGLPFGMLPPQYTGRKYLQLSDSSELKQIGAAIR